MKDSKKRKSKRQKNPDVRNTFRQKRKRTSSNKEHVEEENEKKIFLSIEAYERKSIFNFNDLPLYYQKFNGYTHWERKKIVKDYFKSPNNQYTYEELLTLDDTNKDLQINYAKLIVEKLNKEKDNEKIKIYEEKILKSQIIIDLDDYNKIISEIWDKNLKEKLTYINYKLALINSLQCILENQHDNLKAKEALRLSKRFNFNKWAEIGENNYYFYMLCLQLFEKIDEILELYLFYENILKEMIEFLKNQDFNKFEKDKKFRFDYISYIIFDKNSIKSNTEFKKINNFLYGNEVEKKDLENLFNKGENDKFYHLERSCCKVEYDKDKNKLYFKITEDKKINKKRFPYTLSKSYKANLFNNNIIDLFKKDLTLNFESNLMEHTLPLYDSQLEYYKHIISCFKKNLKKILISDAARNFFKDTYGKKYPDLEYHFDRQDVLAEILQKINFFPIYKENDNGYTNPVDMSIIINCIPIKIGGSRIHLFNRKFLDLGKILVIALHEIFGHFMRRYYSLLTGRIIDFVTPKNNNDKITGKESGDFIESNFLGIEPRKSTLCLRKCLSLLYSPNLTDYPIYKKAGFSMNIDILKKIYNDNKLLFNFINNEKKDKIDNDNEDEEENNHDDEEDNEDDKDEESISIDRFILLEDYLDTLIDMNDVGI